MAPSTTPNTLPMPPSTTIASTLIDSTSTKLSGLMKPWIAENMPPAMPPNARPTCAPDARVLQPQVECDDQEHHDDEEVVILDRSGEREAQDLLGLREAEAPDPEGIDQRDALRPIGDVE